MGTSSPIIGSIGSIGSSLSEETVGGGSKGGKGAGGRVNFLSRLGMGGAARVLVAAASSRVSMRCSLGGVGFSDSNTHCNRFLPKVASFFS